MCGICGMIEHTGRPADAVVLGRMVRSLAHRGPDGEGAHVEGPVGLGHTRLAIMDLSDAGAQPMFLPGGRYALVYNGELYNYPEIMESLRREGAVFSTRCDTEAVLHAYAHWGPACVERFNGMFALALWDARDKTLFLARDRYGKKPLYYANVAGRLLFASEAKAILIHPEFSARLDAQALMEYFTFQNIFTDRTFFRDMRLFPPGAWALVRQGDTRGPAPRRYWRFAFREPERPADDREYEEELDRLFVRAVRRQLQGDTEIGSYLSGGVDSSSVTSVAAERIPYVKTFTCGFDLNSASGLELNFDEREKAEHLSYLLKTEHYEMVLKAGDMQRCMPRLVRHLEEPRLGQSYPVFYAAHLASRFTKVVLTGTGGDEIFGGYPWRYYRAVVNADFEEYVDKYYGYWQRLIPNRDIRQVFSPVRSEVADVWTRDIFRDVFDGPPERLERPEDYVNASLTFEARTFLHGLLLVEDKLSMAHGLEARMPFLDNDLVDFAVNVPARLKLGNLSQVARIDENEPDKLRKFFDNARDGKSILRRVMRRHIPERVCQGAKQGFSGPDASWFKGDSIAYVKNALFKGKSPIYEYLDPRRVRELVMEHLEGKVNRRLLVWSLLYFHEWCGQFPH